MQPGLQVLAESCLPIPLPNASHRPETFPIQRPGQLSKLPIVMFSCDELREGSKAFNIFDPPANHPHVAIMLPRLAPDADAPSPLPVPFRPFFPTLRPHRNVPTFRKIGTSSLIRLELELLGPIREEDVPAICRYLIQTSSSLRYMAVSFEKQELANGSNWHLPILNHALVFPGLQPPKTSEIAKLYDRHFGLPRYPTPSIINALETLRIEGFIDCSDSISGERDYARSQAAFWATRILSKIESPHLFRRMVLQLVLGRAGDLDMCDVRWDFFDEAMGGSTFSNFEYLEFEIVGRKLQLDAVVSLLSLRLPRLAVGGRYM